MAGIMSANWGFLREAPSFQLYDCLGASDFELRTQDKPYVRGAGLFHERWNVKSPPVIGSFTLFRS
jgi:hypothetical protein